MYYEQAAQITSKLSFRDIYWLVVINSLVTFEIYTTTVELHTELLKNLLELKLVEITQQSSEETFQNEKNDLIKEIKIHYDLGDWYLLSVTAEKLLSLQRTNTKLAQPKLTITEFGKDFLNAQELSVTAGDSTVY